ncbi:MAG: dihydrodipicolinate reductase C-terminal domain-containing protein [Geobacteraceae bacterium]
MTTVRICAWKKIGVKISRGGEVIGGHSICFIDRGERIELTHRAYSTDTFA